MAATNLIRRGAAFARRVPFSWGRQTQLSAPIQLDCHQFRCVTLAANVKILRTETSLPIKILSEALKSNDNDIDAARAFIEENEKERLKKLRSKMSSREASEGKLGITINNNVGAMVEIGCETDFVANTDDIKRLYEQVAALVLDQRDASTAGIVGVDNVGELSSVSKLVSETIGVVGENVMVRRAVSMSSTGVVGSYSYKGLYTSLVALKGGSGDDTKLANDLAMHLVAANPEADFPEGLETFLDSSLITDNTKTVREVIGDRTITGYIRWALN